MCFIAASVEVIVNLLFTQLVDFEISLSLRMLN